MITVTLTPEQARALAAVADHALDQAHDTMERDYLQLIIEGNANLDGSATEDREAELEQALVDAVQAINTSFASAS